MASAYATPTTDSVLPYIIYRDGPQDQPVDVTAPLKFFPPRDSDELFDALRAAFPHLKTHSERMRDAMIAFLIEEREAEQLSRVSPVSNPDMSPTWASMTTGTSELSSPDLLNLGTPVSSLNSPLPGSGSSFTRQNSVAGFVKTSPPQLNQMTGVFSLTSTEPLKERVRRKMTDEEKAEYRKRRIVKACDRCAKRKRKCHHNQGEMDATTSLRRARRGKTPSPTATSKQSPVSDSRVQQNRDAKDTTGGLGDISTLDFSEMWSLEDTDMPDQFPELLLDEYFDIATFQTGNGAIDQVHYDPRLSQSSPRMGELQDFGSSFFGFDDLLDSENTMMESGRSESAQAPKPTPTRTTHLCDAEAKNISGLLAGIPIVHKPHGAQLPSSILRLTGTAKALRLFTGLLRERQPSTQHSISLERVASALRSAQSCARTVDGITTRPPMSDTDNVPAGIKLPSGINSAGIKLPSGTRLPSGISHSGIELLSATPHVSVSGISPNLHPGAIQGRLHKVESMDSSRPASGRTLGDGMNSSADPSAASFMLRRRMPKALHNVVDRNNPILTALPCQAAPNQVLPNQALPCQVIHNQAMFSPATQATGSQVLQTIPTSQANGGAYLRPEATYKFSRVEGMVLKETSALSQNHHDSSTCLAEATCSQASGSTPSNGVGVYTERLSDHVRYRDHHGRPQPPAPRREVPKVEQSLATTQHTSWVPHFGLLLTVLAAWFVLESYFTQAIAPTLLLLALTDPQRTIFGGKAATKDTSTWLEGLMYPFTLAPQVYIAA